MTRSKLSQRSDASPSFDSAIDHRRWKTKTKLDAQRPRRLIGGLILLAMAGFPLTVISVEALGVRWQVALGTFLVYLLIQATLMSWLVGILFQQHEMRKFRVGIGAMLIITTMIALPMGATSVYRQQAVPKTVAEKVPGDTSGIANKQELGMIMPIFAGILYFSLIPLLMVCEAILAWYVAKFNRRRSEVD